VVAGGNDVHAGLEHLISRADGQAKAAGGVLAVGDYDVEGQFLAQSRQEFGQGTPTWLADDVADEKDAHAVAYLA
jgi:hypothetical protein